MSGQGTFLEPGTETPAVAGVILAGPVGRRSAAEMAARRLLSTGTPCEVERLADGWIVRSA
jgi:hypothetical protein